MSTRRKWSRTLSVAALMALPALASGCGETRVAMAPEVAVPCRALPVVRVTPRAAIDAMSDQTVMQIDGNNTAIRSGCGR